MTKNKKMKFRLLRGTHVQRVPSDNPSSDAPSKTYEKNDIFESHIDLCERFNGPRHLDPKFERLLDDTDMSQEQEVQSGMNDGLDGMTVVDLRKLAEDEEIEVHPTAKKSELIEAIRSAAVA